MEKQAVQGRLSVCVTVEERPAWRLTHLEGKEIPRYKQTNKIAAKTKTLVQLY